MAWQIDSRGSFAQVLAAMVAIPVPSNVIDRAGLTLAQAYMTTVLTAPPADFAHIQVWLRASGAFDGNALRFEMNLQPIDGVLNQQIMNTPDKFAWALPT